MPCLIGLSDSPNGETRRSAALALCKLSQYKPSRERMVEAGTIPVIIELTKVLYYTSRRNHTSAATH